MLVSLSKCRTYLFVLPNYVIMRKSMNKTINFSKYEKNISAACIDYVLDNYN